MKLFQKVVAIATIAVAAIASNVAQAAASAEFTGAVTTLTSDLATYGGGLVAISVIGVGFGVAIKYIKKLRGAA